MTVSLVIFAKNRVCCLLGNDLSPAHPLLPQVISIIFIVIIITEFLSNSHRE